MFTVLLAKAFVICYSNWALLPYYTTRQVMQLFSVLSTFAPWASNKIRCAGELRYYTI